MATLVRAWNHGAAIMCKAYNPRFDHIIPVLLKDAECRGFGGLYDSWNKEQLAEARNSMSYILIDSKNYPNKTNWRPHIRGIIPQPVNEHNVIQHNLRASLPIRNVYVSMVQDFGMRLDNEPAVIVEPINLAAQTTRPRNTKQIEIILKGIDHTTYKCLEDRPLEVAKKGRDTDREEARRYLAELRNSRVGYLDEEPDKSKKKQLVFKGVVDSLPLVFGQEDDTDVDEEWSNEQSRIREGMHGIERN
jgi:hypothetical protein